MEESFSPTVLASRISSFTAFSRKGLGKSGCCACTQQDQRFLHIPMAKRVCWLQIGLGSSGDAGRSRDEDCDELFEQCFPALARVVDERKEPDIEWQLFLRNASVRSKPGSQQRPAALHRVDVNFVEAVAIVVASIFPASVIDRVVLVAPFFQSAVDVVLVGVDRRAGCNRSTQKRTDRDLLYVRQQVHHDLSRALNHPQNRRLLLGQSAASTSSLQTPSSPPSAFFLTASGCP